MTTTAAGVPLLHRLLGIGLVMIAAVFIVLRYLGMPARLPHNSVTVLMAYTLSAICVVLVGRRGLEVQRWCESH